MANELTAPAPYRPASAITLDQHLQALEKSEGSDKSNVCFVCHQHAIQMFAEFSKDSQRKKVCSNACLEAYVTRSNEAPQIATAATVRAKKVDSKRSRMSVRVPNEPSAAAKKIARYQTTPYPKRAQDGR